MDLALSEWFKFLYEEEDLYGGKKRVINEYTEEGAKATFDWMAENGPNFQTEFDDLFGGKMIKLCLKVWSVLCHPIKGCL